MKLITPPIDPVFPFTFESVLLPNMPEGPEKTAALAWLAKNNPLLTASGTGKNPDPRPFIAGRIVDFIQSPGFYLACKLDPEFGEIFLEIIGALAPEYVNGTAEIPCLLTQYQNISAANRLRLITHLRSLGFPCDDEDSLQ